MRSKIKNLNKKRYKKKEKKNFIKFLIAFSLLINKNQLFIYFFLLTLINDLFYSIYKLNFFSN